MEEMLFSTLDGPSMAGPEAINQAFEIFNPQLVSNFSNQIGSIRDRYTAELELRFIESFKWFVLFVASRGTPISSARATGNRPLRRTSERTLNHFAHHLCLYADC